MASKYRRAKLRGKSFKGQDLTGVDFSGADIRGTDFSGAILRDTNFSHAKAGLQRRWAISLFLLSLLLSTFSGLLSAIGGSLIGFLLVNQARPQENLYVAITSLIVLLIFFLVTVRKGVATACIFLAIAVAATAIAAVGWAGIVAVAWTGIATTQGGAMETAQLVAVVVTGAVGVLAAAFGAVVVATTAAVAGTIAGLIAVALTISVAGAVAGAVSVTAASVNHIPGITAAGVALSVIMIATWTSSRALFGDIKQSWIKNIAIAIATKYGTNFHRADLTDADFTKARLKNTNFDQAILTRTCWLQVTKLHLASVKTTYLENLQLRQLLITKDLHNQVYDGWNLQGLNLQGANLQDVSLIGANLRDSNLQDADISRAKLVQAQLDKTDFRGANLTGAYIGDWRITPQTNLNGVICDYIFMRVPTSVDPNPCRQPANWEATFAPGEFSQFINPFGVQNLV
ncbi:MAG: pentapeptide repeat-containing protein [Calothrix sp. MO_192.B10]|nr:pentapeptide repeat-containing protein [Calothrix sp. MO_192.B10]